MFEIWKGIKKYAYLICLENIGLPTQNPSGTYLLS